MSDHDIMNGGRRRIVSECQAKSFREQAFWRGLVEKETTVHGRMARHFCAVQHLEEEGAVWDLLGAEEQDPGWT